MKHVLMRNLFLFLVIVWVVEMPALSAPVPRKSADFTIYEPSGKTTMLSSFKGKVVMLEFFFVRSPKCLNLAKTMNRLNQEMGGHGFQPIAIAFGPEANGQITNYMVNYFKLTFPVGYTTSEDVDKYLSRGKNEILNIPQVVVIDRNGVIRAQSGERGGDPKLENEASLRELLGNLLKESLPNRSR